MIHQNRRKFMKGLMGISTVAPFLSLDLLRLQEQVRKRKIPASGEFIPIVGVGTWLTFDVGNNQQKRAELKEVLKTLNSFGGVVVDSSPMYGSSEKVVGDLAEELGITNQLFMATKVWTRGRQDGIDQMKRSIGKMGKRPIDLLQVHNLIDWETHLDTLKQWREKGAVRYIGITHYMESDYSRMEHIMKTQPIDFIQLNYSILSRTAERKILPLARDKGIAVIINRPYEGGSLFRKTSGKDIPTWAKEIDIASWGQYFLKFILSNPVVTCVIPGTDKVKHMKDNVGAGIGRLPNEKERDKMVSYLKGL